MPAVGDSLPQSPALTQGSELFCPALVGVWWWSYQVTCRKGLLYNVHELISNRGFFSPNSYNFSAVFWPAPKVFSYLGLWQLKSPLHHFFLSSEISAHLDEVTWAPAQVLEREDWGLRVQSCRTEVRGTFFCSIWLSESASPFPSPEFYPHIIWKLLVEIFHTQFICNAQQVYRAALKRSSLSKSIMHVYKIDNTFGTHVKHGKVF